MKILVTLMILSWRYATAGQKNGALKKFEEQLIVGAFCVDLGRRLSTPSADGTQVAHGAAATALLAKRAVSHFTIEGTRSASVSNIATPCAEPRTILAIDCE